MKVLAHLLGVLVLPLLGNAASLDAARQSYTRSDYGSVVNALRGATDPSALLLLGQSYVMLAKYKEGEDALERAIAADISKGDTQLSSDAHLWLGRAYGRRAEHAFPTSALRLASKTRESLEKAVALNPHNWEALDDLFQYYLQAPAFLGGSLDRAAKLSEAIAKHDPAEAAADRGRIAEQRKDYNTAEAEFRTAAKLAPDQPRRLAELARVQAERRASGS